MYTIVVNKCKFHSLMLYLVMIGARVSYQDRPPLKNKRTKTNHKKYSLPNSSLFKA